MSEEKNTEARAPCRPEAPPGKGEPEISTDELLREVRELTKDVECSDTSESTDEQTSPSPSLPAQSEAEPVKKKKLAWLSELAFYALLVAIVIGAFFIRSNADGRPILIGGFSAFVVETGSMQAEIPQNSLVITRRVDPNTLQVGDDITFMANQTTTITHRIIGITENYADTGQRSFETQGIMNDKPDKNPVPAVNVVGKVVFHSEIVGLMAIFVSKNWPIIIFAAAVLAVLYAVLKKLNAPS